MGIYGKAAILAHNMIINSLCSPLDAWNDAISTITPSSSARAKGCPRATFLAIAYDGYLKGVDAEFTLKKKGILSRRAIEAAKYILLYPDVTKEGLTKYLDYVDKQGAYDIILELAKYGLLQKRQEQISQ